MLGKLNQLFFKGIVILALLPLVPGIIGALAAISPLLVVLVIFGLGSWVIPSFRPFQWVWALISGLAAMLASFFGFLFGWIPFGLRGARFMGPWDRWKLLKSTHKGFLVDGHKKRLSEKVSFESVLTVGGMGRGKSSVFVIPNLLTLDNCSFVVSDTSGEIYEKTSGYLKKQGFRIKVLNLMDPLRSEGYNPLHNATDFTKIAQVAKIIVNSQMQGNPQDVFWNIGAEKIIRILIQCLRNNGDPDFINLANVKHLIANFDAHIAPQGQLGKIDQFIMQATQNDPSTFNDYKGFTVGNPKTMLSFLTTADAVLNAIGNPDLANLTANNSIDFRELRSRKTVLYVLVKQQDMPYYQFLLNLFYTDLFGTLLEQPPGKADLPVYMLLDEFGHLQIPGFEVFATTARKYRVGFWIFLQSLAQLESRYGARGAETILDGLQTEIYLPGQGLDTAKQLEQRLGRMQLQGVAQPGSKALMTADEIIRMRDNRALLLYSNKYPVKLKVRAYYLQRKLRNDNRRSVAFTHVGMRNRIQLISI